MNPWTTLRMMRDFMILHTIASPVARTDSRFQCVNSKLGQIPGSRIANSNLEQISSIVMLNPIARANCRLARRPLERWHQTLLLAAVSI